MQGSLYDSFSIVRLQLAFYLPMITLSWECLGINLYGAAGGESQGSVHTRQMLYTVSPAPGHESGGKVFVHAVSSLWFQTEDWKWVERGDGGEWCNSRFPLYFLFLMMWGRRYSKAKSAKEKMQGHMVRGLIESPERKRGVIWWIIISTQEHSKRSKNLLCCRASLWDFKVGESVPLLCSFASTLVQEGEIKKLRRLLSKG